jgi:hypothetical protein
MTDKVFADGAITKMPHENAPDFVKFGRSYKVAEFIAFLQQHDKNGWVNTQIKISKNGKPYEELDTFEPNRKDVHDAGIADARKAAEPHSSSVPSGFDDLDSDSIPF